MSRLSEQAAITLVLLGSASPAFATDTTINISPYLNGNVAINPQDFPVGLTTGNVGTNIPFHTYSYGSNGYMGSAFLAGSVSPGTSSTLTINLQGDGLTGQQTIYALLNNYFGHAGVNEYNLTVQFTNGQSETYSSIGGQDTRDYNYNVNTAQSIANTTANWWTNIATQGPTAFQRLDVRELTIAPQYQSLIISSLTITQVNSGDPAFLSGLTFSNLPAVQLNTASTPPSLSNITTATGNTISALGVTLNPTFDGGTLTSTSNATSASDFSVTGNGGKIDAAGHTLTFSGVFSDLTQGAAGQLVIANTGQGGGVVLTGTNTIAGGIQVQAGGQLSIPAGSALGSGTLQLLGAGALPAGLTVTGTTSIGNAIQVTGTATYAVGTGTTVTQSGAIADGATSGSIVLGGGGTLTLTAANTYTGATTIAAGTTLALAGAGTIGSSVNVTDNGTLNLSAADTPTIQSLSGTGVVLLGAAPLTLTRASGTFSGALGGSGGLTVVAGIETLTGASTNTGPIAIGAGAALALAGTGAIAASSAVTTNGTFNISGANGDVTIGSLAGAGTITLGARTLTLTQAAGTFSGVIGGIGGLAINGGTETLTGVNAFTGGTSVNGAALSVNGDAALGGQTSGLSLSSATLNALSSLSFARPVTLTGTNTIATGGNTVALSGTAAGPGGLTVTGGGLMTLTGANTYSGGTRVTGGSTLAINADSALGSTAGALTLDNATLRALANLTSARAVAINGGGGTLDPGGFVLSLNGPMALNGALTSSGAGSVLFSNQASGNGTLTIANGIFSNNGQITAQNVTVSASGTLRGTGIFTAPTAVLGTLAPGNSPGTLTFAAPVTLAAGSVTELDIDGTGTGTGAGNYSRILVQGEGNTLTVNGTLQPLLRGITGSASNTYVPPLGQIFNVMSADGGVTGSFAALTQPAGLAPGTRFDTIYASNMVSLVITPAAYGHLASAGLSETPAEAAAGSALDAIRPAAGIPASTALASLFDPLFALPGSSIAPALGQLVPEIYGDALMVARDGWYQMADAVSDQIAARRGNVTSSTTAAGPHGLSFWVSGTGAFSHVASSGGPGFSGTNSGAVAGADKAIAPGAIAGLAIGGVSTTTSSGDGSRASGEAVQFTIYGGWQKGIAFVDGQAVFSNGNQDVRRNLSDWGTGSHSGMNVSGVGTQLHAGLNLPVGSAIMEPLAGLSILTLSSPGLTESADGALAEHLASTSTTSERSLLGVRVGDTFVLPSGSQLSANALVGWEHEFGDTAVRENATFEAAGNAFSVTTVPQARDSVRVGAGVSVPVYARISLFGTYGASVATSGTLQHVMAGARVIW